MENDLCARELMFECQQRQKQQQQKIIQKRIGNSIDINNKIVNRSRMSTRFENGQKLDFPDKNHATEILSLSLAL